jgi:hypothetical protein
VLTARLVCKHWQHSLSQDIRQVTLPYDAWGTTSQSSSSARLASSSVLDQTGWRTAATAAAAALAAGRGEVDLDEAAEAEGTPRPKCARNSKVSSAQQAEAAGAAAAAAAASILPSSSAQQVHEQLDVRAELQEEQAAVSGPVTKAQDSQPNQLPSTVAQQAGQPAQTPADVASKTVKQQHQQQQPAQQAHPLLQLSVSFPACTQVTLSNKRSSWYDSGAPCGSAAVAEAVTLLGQLPKLESLCVQGYMTAADWQPLLSALAGPRQQQEQEQLQQDLQAGQHDAESMGTRVQAGYSTAVDAMAVDDPAHQQQQKQVAQQLQQQLSLRTQLVMLDLQSLQLPPPLLLEAVLGGLQGLRCLHLHASMESILEVRSSSDCF